jgi:hypothetical protein
MTETETPDVWSRDRLMGKSVSFKGISAGAENGENGENGDAPPSPRKRKSKVKADVPKLDPMLWGQPGHLSEEDVDVYVSQVMLMGLWRKEEKDLSALHENPGRIERKPWPELIPDG